MYSVLHHVVNSIAIPTLPPPALRRPLSQVSAVWVGAVDPTLFSISGQFRIMLTNRPLLDSWCSRVVRALVVLCMH